MSKWENTPGPWHVGGDLEVACYNGVNVTRPLYLTSMSGRTDEDKANANLVAAAPELAEALEAMVTKADSRFHDELGWVNSDIRRNAVAALMKAKGEQ